VACTLYTAPNAVALLLSDRVRKSDMFFRALRSFLVLFSILSCSILCGDFAELLFSGLTPLALLHKNFYEVVTVY